MPASTRSQTKQLHVDDASQLKNAVASKKRKSSGASAKQPMKARKIEDDVDDSKQIVTINRAPVLELWAACLAHFLYNDLPWQTCLSIGGAVSTICAISKGRAIGQIDKPDTHTAEKQREKRRKQAEKQELDEVEVMGFTIALENGDALVSGKPKKVKEATLQHKFGDLYDQTKATFSDALESWKEAQHDLDTTAFHMYENFRPTVPPGQKGWGRKGQLNLQHVQSVVRRA